jgi:hypothetical protein
MGGCVSHDSKPIQANRKGGDPDLLKKGEIFYITHKELEKIKGKVVGGKERVELFFGLKNIEEINLSDLYFEVAISSMTNKNLFNQLGHTGKINPETLNYPVTFLVDYVFEYHQYINIDIIYQGKKIDIVKTTLGRIFGSKDHTFELPILIHNSKIIVVLSAHAVKSEVELMEITFDIRTMFNQDMLSNYSVIISNCNFNGQLQKIYKTAQVYGKEFKVITSSLILNDICSGNEDQPILFEFFDSNDSLGSIKASLNDLRKGSFNLKKGPCCISFNIQKTLQFVDYIEAGLQISVLCGIDFTGSNGDPTQKGSLHYLYGLEPNNYELAIRSCCSILSYYDYDQLFPVFGFGAELKGNSMVQHCFNSNLTDDPNCVGIEGIINAYKHALKNVTLSGPTNFSPLIVGMSNSIINTNNSSSVYYILMILTDGSIHDMAQTKDSIYNASFLPLSIIIIGLGDRDDFELMQELDGDEVRLTNSKGQQVNRDIVQFVKYNSYKVDINKLATEVLAEIPKQVQEYYAMNKNFKSYKN